MSGTELWSRLKDSAGNMDVAQITYVMSQEPVKEVYREMMKSFTSFLFEQYKEVFASVPAYQPIVEKYVDTVLKAAQNYGQHAQYLEEENRKLKQELEKLRNVG
jgi:uncharacterized protein Yka (UPF0111/DUF47 family)